MLNGLRNWLADRAVRTAHILASDEGWSVITNDLGSPSMLHGLLRLRSSCIEINSVVDGGACVGDWTRLLKRVYPHASVLLIEPQERHRSALEALAANMGSSVQVVHALVGAVEAAAVGFNVMDDTSGGTGSSVLPEISDVPRHVVAMPMVTLDTLLASRGFPAPDLIKLDVQGYELEVLKGAPLALKNAKCVLLEVSVFQYNEGSPLIQSVVAWMANAGFVVYDLLDISRRRDGVLMQLDLLFARQAPCLQLEKESGALPVTARLETGPMA